MHAARFGESLGEPGHHASELIARLAVRISRLNADPAPALLMAQAEFARPHARDTLTLAFNGVFCMMSWMFLLALLLVPFCKLAPGPPATTAETP